MKKIIKKLLQSSFFHSLISKVAYYYIKLVLFTSRVEVQYEDKDKTEEIRRKPAIYATWHSRFIILPEFGPSKLQPHAVASMHRDGQIIAKIITKSRVGVINGSTSKNATHALRSMLKRLKEGNSIYITPDGPRGPRFKVSSSIVSVASMAQVPIVPMAYSCSRYKILNSWDRFLVPFPFSKIIIYFGMPIHIKRQVKGEEKTVLDKKLEESINNIVKKIDSQLNVISPS